MISERFSQLCAEDISMHQSDGDGIGTYNEKRFHRIFKRLVSEDANCYEVKIGKYVADVLCDGHITEIQTTAFSRLAPKIEFYLANTDYTVSVVIPMIASKKIIRADRETGEIKYIRRSPRVDREAEVFRHLYYIREYLSDPRLLIHIAMVDVEEYRYSDRQRYRREGRYDNDIRPVSLNRELVLRGRDDYKRFVPDILKDVEFDAASYSAQTKLRGREAYSALNTLYSLQLISRREEGRKYLYRYNA